MEPKLYSKGDQKIFTLRFPPVCHVLLLSPSGTAQRNMLPGKQPYRLNRHAVQTLLDDFAGRLNNPSAMTDPIMFPKPCITISIQPVFS